MACPTEETRYTDTYTNQQKQEQPKSWWDNWGKDAAGLGGSILANALGSWAAGQSETEDQVTNKQIQYPKWAENQRKKGIRSLNDYYKAISQGPVQPSPMELGMDQMMYDAFQRGGYFSPKEKAAENQFMKWGTADYNQFFPGQDYATMLQKQLGTMDPIKKQSQTDYMANMASMFPQLGTRGGQVNAAATSYNDMMAKMAGMEQQIYGDVFTKQAEARQKAQLATPQINQMGLNAAMQYGITPQTASQWYGWAGVPRTRQQQMMDWQLGQARIANEMRRAWAQLGYGAPMGSISTVSGGDMNVPWYAALLQGVGQAVPGAISDWLA